MTKVLVLTNDSTLQKFVNLTLQYNGFTVHSATDSAAAWIFLKEVRFDFIMVDYQLKNESGLAFYKALRQFGTSIPVLMLGEGIFDEFMLKDLSPDNYNYILKPFKFRELKMKINTLLQMNKESEELLSYGEFKIDVKQQLVMVKDKILQLGKIEMRILMLLARKTGEVVDPKKIKKLLEAEGNFYSMTPFYYVSKLRTKMKQFAGEAFEINLIKNQGYRLEFRI
ncbi:MAG: response regulator transcription factor [Bdellovibrionales bacterium]|nr:response regulator transcription factor [Bdellovibrionales bacterium]